MQEKNQFLKANIYAKEDAIINLNDIQYIGISNHKFEMKRNTDDNSINATLDLVWVKERQTKYYQLYYIDRCGTTIFYFLMFRGIILFWIICRWYEYTKINYLCSI